MKKLIYSAALFTMVAAFSTSAFAQLQDEKNVTINMELQPILKLEMTSPDQVDFVFDNIAAYAGGITKYGATTLKVSSSVSWDLYAVGTSTDAANGFMDNQVVYGNTADANALTTLPLDILELHSSVDNLAASSDYFLPFQPLVAGVVATPGQNNIDIAAAVTPYDASLVTATKFLQGGPTDAEFGDGGSYLTAPLVPAGTTNYLFSIDYRIIPGLPVIFPTSAAALASPAYARAGVYTMSVKYVLIENQ